jgi:hypothetical protein
VITVEVPPPLDAIEIPGWLTTIGPPELSSTKVPAPSRTRTGSPVEGIEAFATETAFETVLYGAAMDPLPRVSLPAKVAYTVLVDVVVPPNVNQVVVLGVIALKNCPAVGASAGKSTVQDDNTVVGALNPTVFELAGEENRTEDCCASCKSPVIVSPDLRTLFEADPVRFAVTVPAEKFPEASRDTMDDATFDEVASVARFTSSASLSTST